MLTDLHIDAYSLVLFICVLMSFWSSKVTYYKSLALVLLSKQHEMEL